MQATPQFIGLTGGIGSGKSSVSRVLISCGAVVVDADAISRQATASGGLAIKQIVASFGSQAVTQDGAMNRDFMRQLIFNNLAAKFELEAIIHPLVIASTQRQANIAVEQGRACIVFDIPLLVESKRWRYQLSKIVVVDCAEATQISRVIARNGWAVEAVTKVIAAQASRSQRLASADVCIHNDGISIDVLDQLVRRLAPDFGL